MKATSLSNGRLLANALTLKSTSVPCRYREHVLTKFLEYGIITAANWLEAPAGDLPAEPPGF